MKTFKGWMILEVSAQKASKDFETYIAELAVLSQGNTNKIELGKLYDDEKVGTKAKRNDTVNAVIMLNKFFRGKKWDEGKNANAAGVEKTRAEYGVLSAKSDIILTSNNKDYGISVKMKGDIVIASAQNKNEFENIFFSAFNRYKNEFPEITNTQKFQDNIQLLENKIQELRDSVIGETFKRHLKPEHFKKTEYKGQPLKDRKKWVIEGSDKFFEDLRKEIIAENQKIEDHYEAARKGIMSEGAKFINEKLSTNEKLRDYVTHEALSSHLKYKGKLPSANYILSPSGCYDISTPDKPYVKTCAKVSTINIRGMVHGKIRSSRAKGVEGFLETETVDMGNVLSTLDKMDGSLKWDLGSDKVLAKLKSELKKYTEDELSFSQKDEGIFSDIISGIRNKLKGWWNSLKSWGENLVNDAKEIATKALSQLSTFKEASISDILRFNKPKISGTIKLP